MRMIDMIAKKRDGGELSEHEIQYFVQGAVSGEIPDYQTSALLMAVCLQGMSAEETAVMTMAMAHSGDQVDLSTIPGIKVDKHSTGGVGDTTTLIVAPLVAACGVPVAKMSGRGLGHTGGTLDKLESLPGVNIERSVDELIGMVRRIGLAVVGQSGNLVPADKKLYALRDVTATVNSIPLIASSIMSKKIAAGCDAMVLDVKVGSGAFMKTVDDALALARQMVELGESVNRRTVAIVTDMNQPLGNAVGNALEVREAIEALSGGLNENAPLMSVSLLLGQHMLLLAGKADSESAALDMLRQALRSGAGKNKLKELLIALGNDGSCVDQPEQLCAAKYSRNVCVEQRGFITAVNAEQIGMSALILGAGRTAKEDVIDPQAGLVMHKRCGEKMQAGEAVCTLYANDMAKLDEAEKRLRAALTIGKTPQAAMPMIYGVVKP